MSDGSPLKNFMVRLSLDDHDRLTNLKREWGIDRAATLRRLIRAATPNTLVGKEPFFTQIAEDKTGAGFPLRLRSVRGSHEQG